MSKQQEKPAEQKSDSKPYGFTKKISVEDTEGKAAVLTIASVEFRNFAPRSSRQEDRKVVLVYRELPEREHVINRTGFITLVQKLGDANLGEQAYGMVNSPWIGKRVALAPTTRNNPETGEAIEKLDIAAPKRWDALMEADSKQR